MPFVLLVAGVVLVIAGFRGTLGDLWTLLRGDFTGQNNFVYWFLSILVIGSVGYIERLRPIANAFLVLVIAILFLSNKGFFAQFTNALKSTVNAPPQFGGPR